MSSSSILHHQKSKGDHHLLGPKSMQRDEMANSTTRRKEVVASFYASTQTRSFSCVDTSEDPNEFRLFSAWQLYCRRLSPREPTSLLGFGSLLFRSAAPKKGKKLTVEDGNTKAMDAKEIKLIDIAPTSQTVIPVEKSKLDLKDAISFARWVPGRSFCFGLFSISLPLLTSDPF